MDDIDALAHGAVRLAGCGLQTVRAADRDDAPPGFSQTVEEASLVEEPLLSDELCVRPRGFVEPKLAASPQAVERGAMLAREIVVEIAR